MLNKSSVKHVRTTVCFLFISSAVYLVTLLMFVHIFDRLICLSGDVEKNPGPGQKVEKNRLKKINKRPPA